MIKVLTAMGNPILNERLQILRNVSVVGKDVQYQEGVLEILEESLDIDCLIISETLPGEYGFYKLINQIKNIKPKIDIYVFLEEKEENIENYLTSQEIYKIYSLDELDLNEFIKNFDDKKNDVLTGINKEINEFKRLILNENCIEDNYSFIEEKISESFEQTEWEKDECHTIAISGNFGSGKSLISSLLSKVISGKNKKTLLIDLDTENCSINTIFGIIKYKEKQIYVEDFIFKIDDNLDVMCGVDKLINIKENYNGLVIKEFFERLKKDYEVIIIDVSSRMDLKYVKIILTYCDRIIFLIEPNLLEISKSNKILEVFFYDFNIDVDKIKIVFNKSNKYKIAETVLEELFSEFEIIEHLDYEEKYNLLINKNMNINFEETKFERIYEKLIKKEEEIYANASVGNY